MYLQYLEHLPIHFSGAGKSTLLNVLNRRNTSSLTITGDVRVNGADIGSAISVVSGYVQQDDMFIGLLTVEEHLTFHAMLRMSSSLTNVERKERVKNVMTEVINLFFVSPEGNNDFLYYIVREL